MFVSRPIFLALALVGWLAPRPLPAQTPPLGQVAASFGFGASRLLADPVRPRMYAAVPATNSVAVIDTQTLQVVATIFVGSDPVDLALSPDGNTLYTANAGSTTTAVGVVDLNALQALPGLTLSSPATAIAAGLGDRLYVITSGENSSLYQIDGVTGAVQTTVDSSGDDTYLQISPDRRTLYTTTPSLTSFDVSTSTPAPLQARDEDGLSSVLGLRISHDGRTICRPSLNEGMITLFSASDLNSFFGELNEENPGLLAFSSDDSLIYEVPQASDDAGTLHVYSTQTFLQTASLPIPIAASSDNEDYQLFDLATDSTGSYLFISQTNDEVPGNVIVLTTGLGSLTPPNPLPVVGITADTPQIDFSQGQNGRFTLTRTGDVSQPLTVSYTVNDPFEDEDVLKPLKGTKTFQAGRATAGINVVPSADADYYEGSAGLLKLKLAPSAFYTVGKAKARITINP